MTVSYTHLDVYKRQVLGLITMGWGYYLAITSKEMCIRDRSRNRAAGKMRLTAAL